MARVPALDFGGWLIVGGVINAVIPLTCIVVFAANVPGKEVPGALIGVVAILVGAAAAAIGVVLGFLFGVPRVLREVRTDGQTENERLGEGEKLASNTNLEQVSDWLTKIIVGVGLVEIREVPDALRRLASALTPSLGNSAAAGPFVVGLVLYCLFIAFILMYMWTRTRLFDVLRGPSK